LCCLYSLDIFFFFPKSRTLKVQRTYPTEKFDYLTIPTNISPLIATRSKFEELFDSLRLYAVHKYADNIVTENETLVPNIRNDKRRYISAVPWPHRSDVSPRYILRFFFFSFSHLIFSFFFTTTCKNTRDGWAHRRNSYGCDIALDFDIRHVTQPYTNLPVDVTSS
jgi:hypothetical protein